MTAFIIDGNTDPLIGHAGMWKRLRATYDVKLFDPQIQDAHNALNNKGMNTII